MPKEPGRVRSSAAPTPSFMLSRRAGPWERSCYPTPCGAPCRHAWAAGDPNRGPRRAAARHRSVDGRDDHDPWTDRGSAPVGRRARPPSPRGRGRAFPSRGTQRRPDAAPHAPRSAQERGCGSGRSCMRGALMATRRLAETVNSDGARRGNELRVVAKRVRKMRSDQIRLREQERYAHAMGNMQRGPCPERGHEPPHDSRPDTFGDQGVQESGHRCPRHASLDATQRAGRRVIADDDEHGIGCQISNMLKRVAQVGLDDDRVRLVHRHGIDQRVLRFGGRDDVKPTRSKPSLHVADAARRDHAEPVAVRPRAGGRSLCRGRTLEDRHVRRLPVDCRRRPPLRNP